MVDATSAQRIIPGAPPPPQLSKSQKKKRTKVGKPNEGSPIVEIPDSTAAALTEKAPTSSDIQNEHVASELVASLEATNENTAENSKKSSPAVEFIHKRIKLQTKKAARIAAYASKDPSELNEDQKKSVATLPLVQGGIKELEEAKKAIESIDVEEAKELERQRANDEKAAEERITQAISNAKGLYLQRSSSVLSLIRLSAHLTSPDSNTSHLNLNDTERHAIQAIVNSLTTTEGSSKDDLLSELLEGEGSFENVAYERIFLIVESFRHPPIEEDITFADGPEPPVEEVQVEVEAEAEVEAEPSVVEQVEHSVEPTVPITGGFHFMQESELEDTAFEANAEWVEKPEEHENIATDGLSPEVVEPPVLPTVNGGDVEVTLPPTFSGKLDWAADESEEIVEGEFEVNEHANGEADIPGVVNGVAEVAEVDEDGFVKAKSGRGRYPDNRTEYRGRGRGGFRGDRGDRGGEHRGGGFRGRGDGGFRNRDDGGFRGRDDGGFRGRDDGESRGRGGFRGGDDGESRGRGGFRGGDDGESRGRGGFRGGDRGRGDFRGRGRGGGDFRGDFRGRGRGGERGGGFRGGRGGNNENRSVAQPISS